jgi:hypothetical protein
MAEITETLKKLGLATARGVPQLATGFVDLAALPFTMTGMLKPEQAVGSTAYLTSKGLLPPEQKGLLSETTELVSGALNPATATKAALAKGGMLMAAPIAFHGSPYKFDKFDISKILSGEGNTQYGYGTYFSESPEVARSYKEALSGGAKKVMNASFSKDPELWTASQIYSKIPEEDIVSGLDVLGYKGDPNKLINSAKNRLQNELNVGSLYKVDIPDAKTATFLDWDKKISDQKNAANIVNELNKKFNFGYDKSFTGGDLYNALTVDFMSANKGMKPIEAQKLASETLSAIGIKGIQYFDQASRKTQKGTRNYVVFDPSDVKMLERNEKPIK